MKYLLSSSVAFVALTASGCTPAGEGGRSLRSTTISPSFTFQASQGLTVAVAAEDRLFGDKDDAQIILSRPDGAALFRGAIRKGETTDLRVLAPRADRSVTVIVNGRGGESRTTLSADKNGRISGKVQ